MYLFNLSIIKTVYNLPPGITHISLKWLFLHAEIHICVAILNGALYNPIIEILFKCLFNKCNAYSSPLAYDSELCC